MSSHNDMNVKVGDDLENELLKVVVKVANQLAYLGFYLNVLQTTLFSSFSSKHSFVL